MGGGVAHAAVSLLPPDTHGVVLVRQMSSGGGAYIHNIIIKISRLAQREARGDNFES